MESKSSKLNFARETLITRDGWEAPVRVREEAYCEFSRGIEQGLRQLVDRWEHAAAPRASAPRGRR